MEQLVIYLLKLLFQLAFVLLKFAVRVVLFAWTGDWHKLDKVLQRARELLKQAREEEAQAAAPATRPKRVRKPRKARPEGPWPFEFNPELTSPEPDQELVGGEALTQAGGVRRPPPPSGRPPPRVQPLAQAIRQPGMLRDAMVLTALLGPRTRRGRHF
ncbi:MAG TPA: hypothetical protein VI299_00700 [Polyangiales bacterium]